MKVIKKCSKVYDYGKQVVILQRGWVFVGDLTREDNECTLENASTIRNWGTTKGLGEIADGGPTSSTKLDPSPTVRFNWLTVIGIIECNQKNWNK